jgi:hypothetical protein
LRVADSGALEHPGQATGCLCNPGTMGVVVSYLFAPHPRKLPCHTQDPSSHPRLPERLRPEAAIPLTHEAPRAREAGL